MGSHTLTIQNGLTSSINKAPDPDAFIDANINLPTFQTWNVTTGLTVNGVISGIGGINDMGGGQVGPMLTLGSANTYSGGTTVRGRLGVGNDAALGSGLVTINGGNLTALNGVKTLGNAISFGPNLNFISGDSFIFNGTVDLQGGTARLFNNSATPIRFANVVGNGILSLNRGAWSLEASNTFSELQLYDGGKAIVGSASNLGGSSTSIRFGGAPGNPAGSGTLRTTSSFTLSNPISFNQPQSNGYGTFEVDAGTTLILNSSISASTSDNTINKTGAGTLNLATNRVVDTRLNIYGGNVVSGNNSLANALVQVNSGGTFSGTGNVGTTRGFSLNGGNVAPGGGGGTMITSTLFSSLSTPSNLQFELSLEGSPNYANLANSGNGLLSFASVGSSSGGSLTGNNISIFFDRPSLDIGDTFRGALFSQSATEPSAVVLNGVNFTYYNASPTGTFTFNGQTYALLESQSAVSHNWVSESAAFGGGPLIAGQVLEFQITAPIPENGTLSTLLIGLLGLALFKRRRGQHAQANE